jgi:inhibitor of cysteine peptidase
MLVIDETWNHRDAEIAIGETVKLELSENPTTGYRWSIPDVGPALRILDESYEAPSGAPGSGGVRRWTLAADKAGTIPLQLEFKRSWQPQPARTFAVTLVVKAR